MQSLSARGSERFSTSAQSMPGMYLHNFLFIQKRFYFVLTNFYSTYTGSIISYQKNIHSPYDPTYDRPTPPPPYHPPYFPYLPTAVHHPHHLSNASTSASLPQVNDAFSRVERDLKNLNDTFSHPYTVNDPTSYHRAVNISSKVDQLTSMVGSLREKLTSYEKCRIASPDARHYKNLPNSSRPIIKPPSKNVKIAPNIVSPSLRPPFVPPPNSYIKNKKRPFWMFGLVIIVCRSLFK